MIMADKIIELRKKNGWSQEELAEKLGVSRQSVSKWESAQSVPDLKKILTMSEIFGVSTDYLLKDEVEDTGEPGPDAVGDPPLRKVSMEQASDFLRITESIAGKMAFGVMLCILSPITLIMMAAASEVKGFPLSEDSAAGVGLVTLILMITAAVAIFITQDNKLKPYKFLDHEDIDTEYGVEGMVKEKLAATESLEKWRKKYARGQISSAYCSAYFPYCPFSPRLFSTTRSATWQQRAALPRCSASVPSAYCCLP